MSSGLALSLGLIARHDLKNEAAGEISFSGIVPHCVSKFSSFPRISFAVTMGEATYESEKSGVPVNKRNVYNNNKLIIINFSNEIKGDSQSTPTSIHQI